MQKHPGFSMWKPCAQLMFQMAMDCDPEGKDRYLQCCFSGGSFVGGSSDPAAAIAFYKTHLGKVYRTLTFESKYHFGNAL